MFIYSSSEMFRVLYNAYDYLFIINFILIIILMQQYNTVGLDLLFVLMRILMNKLEE